MLPRAGGVLDQPADEVIKLEAILDAFGRWEELKSRRSETRDRNRARHAQHTEEVV